MKYFISICTTFNVYVKRFELPWVELWCTNKLVFAFVKVRVSNVRRNATGILLQTWPSIHS